jgi:hypothetical protein
MHYVLSTVNSHALPSVNSICLLYIVWCGFRLSCYTTRETRQHSTRAVVISHTDDFFQLSQSRALTICSGSIWSISTLCLATAIWTFRATSFNSCLQACSRAWHPWGLSPVWLNVLRTFVCMSVFDFRAYDVQLKTKLQFSGRVNNNACAQSCTTFCQLYMSTLYCLMRFRLSWYTTRETLQHSTRAVVIEHTDDFLRVFMSQHVGPLRQPASAAASRRVLEPDILEVSHLCGCMYWEFVCIAVFDFRAYDRQLKTTF